MECLHWPTPIPIPIPTELGAIILLRRVYGGPMLIPILMQMGTVPNLTLILVPARCL